MVTRGSTVDVLEIEGNEGKDGKPQEQHVAGLPLRLCRPFLALQQLQGGLQIAGLMAKESHCTNNKR